MLSSLKPSSRRQESCDRLITPPPTAVRARPNHLFLIVPLMLAILLLVACGGDEAETGASSAPDSSPPTVQPATAAPTVAPTAPQEATALPAAAALPDDAKAAVLQAMRAQLTAGAYRTQTTITGEDFAQEATGEIIPPDRMHIVMQVGEIATEMIYIGDKVWSRQGDAAWQVADRLGMPGSGLLDESMIADSEKTITEATFVGKETVEGVDALVYSFTSDLNKSEIMPMDSVSQSKVWIDAATGLIVRLEVEDDTMGMKSKTVQVIEYDPSITIEPPVQ